MVIAQVASCFGDGPGIIDANAGIWQPDASMIGQPTQIFLSYTEDLCLTQDSIGIEVFQQPDASFTIDPVICLDASATAQSQGVVTEQDLAVFNWGFDGATASPGTGIGPHTLNGPIAGNYTISLELEENGCIDNHEESILVEPTLEAPIINCTAGVTSLSFSWDEVANADSYTVTVLQGPDGLLQNGNIYTIQKFVAQ